MQRRPRALLLCAVLVTVASCDDGGTAERPATESTPPTSRVTAAGGAQRWGEGRALFARFDPAADRTVVATTIGVAVQVGDEPPVSLTDQMPTALALSPDGRLAAFTTAADQLELWDVNAATRSDRHSVTADRYTGLAFTSADTIVASGEADVTLFGADGRAETLAEAPAGATLGPVAVSAAGDVAVPVPASRPTLVTWNEADGRRDVDLGLVDGTRFTGVTWSPDGSHLAVLHALPDQGDSVGIWDVEAASYSATVALPNYVTPEQLAFLDAGRGVVIPFADRVARFDMTGREVASLAVSPSAVSEIIPAGDEVVIVGRDGAVTTWDGEGSPAEVAPAGVTFVDNELAEGTLVTVDQSGRIRELDVGAAREIRTLDRWALGEVTSVDLGPGAGRVALATSTGAVRLLRTTDGSVEHVLDRPQGRVADVSIAPGDDLVATGVSVQLRSEAWDDTVAVTAVDSGESALQLGGEAEDVTGCAFYQAHVVFSPDGRLLASSSHDFTVQVSTLGAEDDVEVLEPHRGSVLDIEFSPDGSLLATSADDGTLRIWEVDGWRLRDEFTTVAGGYWAMAFTPDGSGLAVADITGQLSILDPATAEVLRTFTGTPAPLADLEIVPDGSRLVAGGTNGSVDVWSVATGAIETRFEGHTLPVTAISVADDGSAVVSGSKDGTVRYWPLPGVAGD